MRGVLIVHDDEMIVSRKITLVGNCAFLSRKRIYVSESLWSEIGEILKNCDCYRPATRLNAYGTRPVNVDSQVVHADDQFMRLI